MYWCFTSAVTAKVTDNGGTSKTYRVVSLINDENKILNFDTRQDINYTSVDFFIMGYAEHRTNYKAVSLVT